MRLLSNVAMLAGILALGVVLTGNVTVAQKLLGKAPQTAAASAPAAVAQAKGAGAAQTFGALISDTEADSVGSGGSAGASLASYLAKQEPSARVNQPLSSGGTDVHVSADGKVVAFCAEPVGGTFSCTALELKRRMQANGSASSEQQALYAALGALQKQGATSSQATGGGLASQLANRAHQLAGK